MPKHLPVEDVKALLEEHAPRLGHIALFAFREEIPVAAIHWEEFDETNAWQKCDAVYLVWRSESEGLQCRRITDSNEAGGFFCLNGIRLEGEEVVISLQHSLAPHPDPRDDQVCRVPIRELEGLSRGNG